jgi:hypothetical protein
LPKILKNKPASCRAWNDGRRRFLVEKKSSFSREYHASNQYTIEIKLNTENKKSGAVNTPDQDSPSEFSLSAL